MIKCVTFDLDDTLWPVAPVIDHANEMLFDWLDQYAPAFTGQYSVHDLDHLRRAVLSQEPDISYSVTRIRIAQLKHGLATVGYQTDEVDTLAAQAFEVFIAARQKVSFFEHALDMLADLKQQGFQLGALSNGNADIHRVGLGELFDFQFKADDVGFMKPHPAMFEHMLKHTELAPEQVVHVGDNPDHDVQGAKALGIKTILMNPKGLTTDCEPDTQITHLNQVVDKIHQLAKNS